MFGWQASCGSQHHQLCCQDLQFLIQTCVAPSHGPPARVLSSLSFLQHLLLPKPGAKGSTPNRVVPTLSCQSCVVPPSMAAAPGIKSPHQSSSTAPFLIPPTISYTCQHSPILPALLDCHSKSRQAWHCGVEPIIFKLSRRCCNQGELSPSYILGWSHSHPSGSKHGHSYLTYPWNQ